MQYSAGFRTRMIQRLAGPDGISSRQLAMEVGVAQTTLSKWLRESGNVGQMKKNKQTQQGHGPDQFPASEKLRIVHEASQLSEDELGAFLRKEGTHSTQLAQWREIAKELFGMKPNTATKRHAADQKKIAELQRELRRKDSALAEVTALLMLKKKLEMLLGDEDDDIRGRSGR